MNIEQETDRVRAAYDLGFNAGERAAMLDTDRRVDRGIGIGAVFGMIFGFILTVLLLSIMSGALS